MSLQKLLSSIGKYIKYPILVTLTALVTVYWYNYDNRNNNIDVVTYTTPDTYKDINDKIHNVIEKKNISVNSHKDYADSLSRLLKIRTKELKDVTSSLSKMKVVHVDKPIIISTTKDTAYSLTKEDNWVKIHAYVSKDTGSITFFARDSLTISQYTKRKLFKTIDYIDIQHSNPYIEVEKAYSISFERKSPRITIGPYIGYGYNPTLNKFSPNVGVGITIPLIKIK